MCRHLPSLSSLRSTPRPPLILRQTTDILLINPLYNCSTTTSSSPCPVSAVWVQGLDIRFFGVCTGGFNLLEKGERKDLGVIPRAGSWRRRLPFLPEMYPSTVSESLPQNPNAFPATTLIYLSNIFSKFFLRGSNLFGHILSNSFAPLQAPLVWMSPLYRSYLGQGSYFLI